MVIVTISEWIRIPEPSRCVRDLLDIRAIAAHNRAVTRRRGGACAVDSVKVPAQRGVSQRNRRLVHTSTVGRS